MINAKKEFLKHIDEAMEHNNQICAPYLVRAIILNNHPKKTKLSVLSLKYSDIELDNFLKSLNYRYDNENPFQILSGVIWYSNGAWSKRIIEQNIHKWEYKQAPRFEYILTTYEEKYKYLNESKKN